MLITTKYENEGVWVQSKEDVFMNIEQMSTVHKMMHESMGIV